MLFFRRFVEKSRKGFTNAEKYGIIIAVFSVRTRICEVFVQFCVEKDAIL